MPKTDRCVVVAVCGSPGAGKTTIAAAAAAHLGVPLLARDEIKAGLGLSSAKSAKDASIQLDRDFFIAGGPFSRRAEAAMVEAARVLASSGVSLVVESSVLSRELLDVLHGCQARVLAVHVVADEAVIGARLRVRAAKGWAMDEQLAAAFERGGMEPAIFAPPGGVDGVIEVDTSGSGEPPVHRIEAAFVGVLTSGSSTAGLGNRHKRT